jgi:ADP-ribosyl-[dinitrogen reductase] hydrolase
MAFALGAALIEANGLDVKTIADHFVGWMKSRPIDMGATVRRGIRRYIATGSLEAPLMDDAAGNGGVMRNLPVILATLNDAAAFEAWTLAQCRFTHHNEKSDAGSIYLSELTRMAILEGQRAPLATFARDTIDRLGIGFDHTRFRSGPSDGYILSTIQIALYFFFNTYDFESLLIGVVNQGGDADTNAAIAGQMGGAFYGPEAIPKRWLAKLDKQVIRTIEEQVDRLLALSGDRYGLD